MSLILRNFQRHVPLSERVIQQDIQILRQASSSQCFDMAVIFINSFRMREISREYKGKDSSTDILSFPYHDDILVPGDMTFVENVEERNIGDIYICPSVMLEKYDIHEAHSRTVLVPLLAHGLSHLLGFHHSCDKSTRDMVTFERKLLHYWAKKVHKPFEILYDFYS